MTHEHVAIRPPTSLRPHVRQRPALSPMMMCAAVHPAATNITLTPYSMAGRLVSQRCLTAWLHQGRVTRRLCWLGTAAECRLLQQCKLQPYAETRDAAEPAGCSCQPQCTMPPGRHCWGQSCRSSTWPSEWDMQWAFHPQ